MIELTGVTLVRRLPDADDYDLKSRLLNALTGRRRPPSRRTVLDKVDLRIAAGEKVGIIGANGAGKSTLLKVICGVLQPTAGSVRVAGRVAPVLELGAGFDPELSVAENVIFYGVLLGFTRRDMLERCDDILAFAELEDYRHAPVRVLSTGMTARLGFAVATDVEPDVLLLDEILSVGDERFRAKSQRRIMRMWDAEATALLVSHDLAFIRTSCTRALWIDRGQIRANGAPEDTVEAYLEWVDANAEQAIAKVRAGS